MLDVINDSDVEDCEEGLLLLDDADNCNASEGRHEPCQDSFDTFDLSPTDIGVKQGLK